MRLLVLGVGLALTLSSCGPPRGQIRADDSKGATSSATPGESSNQTSSDNASAPAPEALTEKDAGGYRLAIGDRTRIRLSNQWVWSAPIISGESAEVAPVDARTDPGYREWEIIGRSSGSVSLSWEGEPNCERREDCPPRSVVFEFEVE